MESSQIEVLLNLKKKKKDQVVFLQIADLLAIACDRLLKFISESGMEKNNWLKFNSGESVVNFRLKCMLPIPRKLKMQ